jgi:uncharacterized protein YndB with AHSA1/START domain
MAVRREIDVDASPEEVFEALEMLAASFALVPA